MSTKMKSPKQRILTKQRILAFKKFDFEKFTDNIA